MHTSAPHLFFSAAESSNKRDLDPETTRDVGYWMRLSVQHHICSMAILYSPGQHSLKKPRLLKIHFANTRVILLSRARWVSMEMQPCITTPQSIRPQNVTCLRLFNTTDILERDRAGQQSNPHIIR
eukprot:2718309-Amphidinium_carterae.1